MNREIKAVVFDADGMIVRGDRFSERLEKRFGITRAVTKSFFEGPFQLCLTGKADLKNELPSYFQSWGWKNDLDGLLNFWFTEEHTIIDSRFEQVISKLKSVGIAVYLATNNEKYRTENLVVGRGLGTWFQKVFSSYDLGAKKPEAIFFQQIVDDVGIDKADIVFWDDDAVNVDGARAFGIPSERFFDFRQFEGKIEHLIEAT